jgi:hypothetical protein
MRRQSTTGTPTNGALRLPRNEPSSRDQAPTASLAIDACQSTSRYTYEWRSALPRNEPSSREPSADREPSPSMRRQSTSRYRYEWRSAPSQYEPSIGNTMMIAIVRSFLP